jgi:hypothetical protein
MNAGGVRLINGKQPLLRQIVFEVRYNHGYTYLDRCGKILNRISREYAEWVVGNQVNPQNAPLYSLRNGCRFVFNTLSGNSAIDRSMSDELILDEDIVLFSEQSEELTTVLIDELGLKDFSRIGFRSFYYFPCETKEEAEKWVQDLGILSVSPDLLSAFGGNLESVAASAVVAGQDHRIRIGINSVETPHQLEAGAETLSIRASGLPRDKRQLLEQIRARRRLERNTRFAAVIDFDSFQEEPISVNPREFIMSNSGLFLDRLYSLLSPAKRAKGK